MMRRSQVFLMVSGIVCLITGLISLFFTNSIFPLLLIVISIILNSIWVVMIQFDREKKRKKEIEADSDITDKS